MKTLWQDTGTPLQMRAIAYCAGHDTAPSRGFDYLLLPFDIAASKAHCAMLDKQKVIAAHDAEKITAALGALEANIPANFLDRFEDCHSAIENYLVQTCGSAGENIHAGRSRNDQASTALLLAEKHYAKQLASNLKVLAQMLDKAAANGKGKSLPGFSHHQPAMPTTWETFFASYAVQVQRATKLLDFFDKHYCNCPLGAAAGYGTSISIDPSQTAVALGFDGPFENSVDAVANRWEADSLLAYSSCIALNACANLSQSLILFSTKQFGYVALPKELTTGSSMMPQKRNPDVLEVTKAKAAMASGNLQQILSIGRGLFFGYNRELQYSKYAALSSVLEAMDAPLILAQVVDGISINYAHSADETGQYGTNATRQAEALFLRGGMTFRQAKFAVEKAIKS